MTEWKEDKDVKLTKKEAMAFSIGAVMYFAVLALIVK